MGTFGVKLYEDDLALDVRADYKNFLKETKSDEKTLQCIF